MKEEHVISDLINLGLSEENAIVLAKSISVQCETTHTPAQVWSRIIPLLSGYSFSIHLYFFNLLFPGWQQSPEYAQAFIPDQKIIDSANVSQFMAELSIKTVKELHDYSLTHREDFYQRVIQKLNIQFQQPYQKIGELTNIEEPHWLIGAQFNIVDSCFTAQENATAIIYEDEQKNLIKMSYSELNQLANRVANSLIQHGFTAQDAIAIIMPMNVFAVAIYLGIIKMGGVVVSIADSFSTPEILLRLSIAHAKALFTQGIHYWNDKKIFLYDKIKNSNAVKAIVLKDKSSTDTLRKNDLAWEDFLVAKNDFVSHGAKADTPCNILFSSGTTKAPKAIPWTHVTPIRVAMDAYFHQNIKPGCVLAWPTNLGWMMGPWLIFAALMNQATIAVYSESPKDRAFGLFVERARVTMLGLVPSLVHAWRQTRCMEGLAWDHINAFSSSGECSNPEDMFYLMFLAGYKPIIEYCGGTEIGGAYLSSTVIQNNYPSLFSTPTMGMNIVIVNEQGELTDEGEVAIIPPAIGLSTTLLNANHHDVYFKNMPEINHKKSRRHGDEIKRFANGYYCILGRSDDAMNLGGIKVSAAEIERTLIGISPHIIELAAIAVSPMQRGPQQLIIYLATQNSLDKDSIKTLMQNKINTELNPLFKIHDVMCVSSLPKTASNKIIRRLLRDEYEKKIS